MPLTKSEYNGIYGKLSTLIRDVDKATSDDDALIQKINVASSFEEDADLQALASSEYADITGDLGMMKAHLTDTVKPFLQGLKPVTAAAKAVSAPTPTPSVATPTITPAFTTPCARPCIVRAKPSIKRG